jgi:hypothetical protein
MDKEEAHEGDDASIADRNSYNLIYMYHRRLIIDILKSPEFIRRTMAPQTYTPPIAIQVGPAPTSEGAIRVAFCPRQQNTHPKMTSDDSSTRTAALHSLILQRTSIGSRSRDPSAYTRNQEDYFITPSHKRSFPSAGKHVPCDWNQRCSTEDHRSTEAHSDTSLAVRRTTSRDCCPWPPARRVRLSRCSRDGQRVARQQQRCQERERRQVKPSYASLHFFRQQWEYKPHSRTFVAA